MPLLRDIQDAAVDNNIDICNLLRKCKILAARLNNKEFSDWIDYELNGYNDKGDLPIYRVLNTQSYGFFAGPFGSSMDNAPIPPSCIPKEVSYMTTTSYLIGPISAYAALVNDAKNTGENFKDPWPQDMVTRFANDIYENMACLSAWKMIPYGAMVSVIDTIKTRILDFSLAIEKEAPDAGEAPQNTSPVPQEKVSQIFTTYITGNVQNVALGNDNVSQDGEFNVTAGDLSSLKSALDSLGVSNKDFDDLKAAIQADKDPNDKPAYGENTKSWLEKMVSHAEAGALAVGTSVASTMLSNYLFSFFGMQ